MESSERGRESQAKQSWIPPKGTRGATEQQTMLAASLEPPPPPPNTHIQKQCAFTSVLASFQDSGKWILHKDKLSSISMSRCKQ